MERLRDSGLSAEQFAAELGINANTLKFWKCVFRANLNARSDAI